MIQSEKNNLPIYMQVVQDFKFQISSGILKPKDKLPSVRELALSLMVNPNTVQKAYKELEDEGYIVTVIGKGNFVAEDLSNALSTLVDNEMNKILTSVNKLTNSGYELDKIIERIKKGK